MCPECGDVGLIIEFGVPMPNGSGFVRDAPRPSHRCPDCLAVWGDSVPPFWENERVDYFTVGHFGGREDRRVSVFKVEGGVPPGAACNWLDDQGQRSCGAVLVELSFELAMKAGRDHYLEHRKATEGGVNNG